MVNNEQTDICLRINPKKILSNEQIDICMKINPKKDGKQYTTRYLLINQPKRNIPNNEQTDMCLKINPKKIV